MEWQKAKLLLEKSERHDESGLEPTYCVCVCVWTGRVSWVGLLFGSWCHAMFDKHSCPRWPYSCPWTVTVLGKCSCVCVLCAVWMYVSVTLCVQYGPCVFDGGGWHAPWESRGRLSVSEQQRQESALQTAAKLQNCSDGCTVTVQTLGRWRDDKEMSLADCHGQEKLFNLGNFLNKTCSILSTDRRDAPERVWLHPHRRPSGVQTSAPLGHVSSAAPGDIGSSGQPATCRDWWVWCNRMRMGQIQGRGFVWACIISASS